MLERMKLPCRWHAAIVGRRGGATLGRHGGNRILALTRASSGQRGDRTMMKDLVPALLGAGACFALANPALAQQRLTVATYGGNWGEAQKACILDPFAKASGGQGVHEATGSTVTYNKPKQQKGHSSISKTWLSGRTS